MLSQAKIFSLIESTYQDAEKTFVGMPWIQFTRDNTDIPIYTVAIYVFIVFVLPGYLKSGQKMKKRFTFWNLILSIFSWIGASRVVPTLYKNLTEKGFQYTVCEDPQNWYLDGASGLWVMLFIYSKIPELLDTLFLVLQKPERPVIFLHWFHHLTVLLYCWHAYHHKIAPGIWFAAMNYCVHAVMYLYYMFMVSGNGWVVKPFAQFITVIQIAQMIVGTTVTASSAYYYYTSDGNCAVNPSNFRMGLAMYSAYFALFVKLFVNKYCGKKSSPRSKTVCSASDDAGHFVNTKDFSNEDGRVSRTKKSSNENRRVTRSQKKNK